MDAKSVMIIGELYCVPEPTGPNQIRDVEGGVVAECPDLGHAAVIADGYTAAVDLIREMDRIELSKVVERIRTGTATDQDAEYVENRLAKFCWQKGY